MRRVTRETTVESKNATTSIKKLRDAFEAQKRAYLKDPYPSYDNRIEHV